ncbi:MAG: WG repeat-containing protein [Desulfobacteraceae bacterium]|nr:WG repeat-containing protein [Desulfobacteraceae bacterium]
MWDNAPDCEHEEKIRFRDKTTDKVGFFDKNGHKIIPALYSDALPFRNNMAVVLENAERVCWGGEKYSDKKKCEHWSWKGGQTHLINEDNEILIENFKYERNLDWFSLKIMGTKGNELIRDSFKGTNGKYYSFINFEKEFKHWFESNFLISTNINALRDNCFSEITFWSNRKSDWIKKDINDFLAKNKKVLLQQMNDFRQGILSYSIQRYPIEPFIWRNAQNKQYFDLCENYKHWQNPVFDVVVSYRNKKGILELDAKNHFLFLKTDDGYKLISLGLKGEEL